MGSDPVLRVRPMEEACPSESPSSLLGKLIRVMVPATTANLGPGFDCLGMALDIWNEVVIEVSEAPAISVQGQGATELPADKSNLVYRVMEHLFREANLQMPILQLHCRNEIPLKRGLGSSSAAIVGGLVAANGLYPQVPGSHGRPFSSEQIVDMAAQLEGHPDNVTPALLGGLRLVVQEGDALRSAPVPIVDDIHAVLFIPEMSIATEDARAVLPKTVSRGDAVYNMGRVALLVNALATGRLDDLRVATEDRLHQPYRQKLFPAMKVILSAAMNAGALGAFLSGSGSTILALTKGKEMTVAYEMAEAARQACVEGTVRITRPTPRGAHLVGTSSGKN